MYIGSIALALSLIQDACSELFLQTPVIQYCGLPFLPLADSEHIGTSDIYELVPVKLTFSPLTLSFTRLGPTHQKGAILY